MISRDQDAVAARAREATPDDVAEDKELRAAARALEAEPEDLKAYEALVAAYARRGLSEPVDRKPISAMSVVEIAAARNNYPSSTDWSSPERKRYYALEERKNDLGDEIAAARVTARKGVAPDPAWVGSEDPRLVAWRSVAWARAYAALNRSAAVPQLCPTLEGIVALEKEAAVAHRTLRAILDLLQGGGAAK